MRVALLLLFLFSLLSGCSEPSSAPSVGSTGTDDPYPELKPADPPEAIAALTAMGATFRINSGGLVTEVNLRGSEATDDALTHVAVLPAVTSVLLNDLPITDKGLSLLASTEAPIANLDLRGCQISNAGLGYVTSFRRLRALRLNGADGSTTVDDEGLSALAVLPELKVLALDGLFVSEAGLEVLPSLKRLEELYLKNTLIGDDALKIIGRCSGLKKLRLAFNQISDMSLQDLAPLTSLTDLDLSENAGLTDAALTHVAALKSLTRLNLWRVAVSDQGVAALADLKSLQWLNLDNTQLSDAGLPALSGLTELRFLHLGSTTVTNAGLVHLEPLTGLEQLIVTRCGVDESGAAALQEKLPDTEIQVKYLGGD